MWPQRALVTTNGTRLKLSAPPASAISLWPVWICAPAETMACSPVPQARTTASALVSSGSPALMPTTRALNIESRSGNIVLPNTMWSMSSAFRPDLASDAFAAWAPRSVIATSLSEPPKSPKAVRTPAARITSRGILLSVFI